MADSFLPYQNPDTTDAKLDTESLTVGADTVHRERIQIAGTGAADIAPVDPTAGVKVDLGTDNDVSVTSSALPTGAATSAKQDTIIGHVDGIEATLGTIGADTGNISTKIDTIAGAVSGSEVQVDVLTMPTTTVQASNLDIRDIDKASDDITVYANTAKDGSGTAYVPVVDSDGHLQIDVLSMPAGGSGLTDAELRATPVPVSGTVTANLSATDNAVLDDIAADTESIKTAVEIIDDIVKTEDAVHASGDKGVMALGVVNANFNTLAAEGDYAPLQLDQFGRQFVIEDSAAAIKTAVETIDNAISGSEMQVDVVASLPAGTNAIGKLAANSGVDIGDVDVTSITGVTMSNAAIQTTGDEAHDAPDDGNPVKIGAKAIAHGANPTAVAANDRTNLYANRHGIQFVMAGHPNTLLASANYTDADGAQTNAALISVSAGTKIVVTHITVTCDGANSADTQVRIGFGTANTPANDAAKVLLSHPGIKPGGGIGLGNGGGILGIGADDEDLRITCEDPTGGALDVVVGYYTIES